MVSARGEVMRRTRHPRWRVFKVCSRWFRKGVFGRTHAALGTAPGVRKKGRPASLPAQFPAPKLSGGTLKIRLKVKALVAQSCLTLCNPVDCSPPGFSVQGLSRQEHWSGLPCPPPGDLPNPEISLPKKYAW